MRYVWECHLCLLSLMTQAPAILMPLVIATVRNEHDRMLRTTRN